jgi:glycoprotein-N-acetylgalactosamine 3-beta-galactosyltransferase
MYLITMSFITGTYGENPRIYCMVYTHKGKRERQLSQHETWGSACDGINFFSDEPAPKHIHEDLEVVHLKHAGPESWGNMWQKSRSIWLYAYEQHINNYDFFFISGDDTYVIVENLKKYVASTEVREANKESKGLYLGRRFLHRKPDNITFNSGGSGYVLSRKALKVLHTLLVVDHCHEKDHDSREDYMVAACLKKQGILPYNTQEPSGAEIFHPFKPEFPMSYDPSTDTGWYKQYVLPYGLTTGLEGVSTSSIVWHYIYDGQMEDMHRMLYECRERLSPGWGMCLGKCTDG